MQLTFQFSFPSHCPLWGTTQPPLLIHAWSFSSTLHDSQWGSASSSADPSRAPLWVASFSPSFFFVLTRLIPHGLPVKGPKPWLLVVHANIPVWKMGQRASERVRQTEAKTVIATAADHRQTLRVEWINALSSWDRVHSLSQTSTHA